MRQNKLLWLYSASAFPAVSIRTVAGQKLLSLVPETKGRCSSLPVLLEASLLEASR